MEVGTTIRSAARQPPFIVLASISFNDLIRLWGKVEKVQLLESRLFTGRPTSDNSQLAMLFENKALATIYALILR